MNTNRFKHSILIIALMLLSLHGFSQSKSILVNQERLENSILELAKFGQDPENTGELSRVAYSDGDIKGREYVISLMRKAGLEVSIDYAGNIIGKKQGTDNSKPPIAFGSHIDSVPNGGNYDGCVGSLGAIEVLQTLQDQNITTEHPLELIIFSNEEAAVVGSRAMAGALKPEALNESSPSGYTIAEGIKRIGGNPDKIPELKRKKGDVTAFLELHIEQGAVLDQENIQIGVVEGIVAIEWWDITINGFANHAGTTPMDIRKDAMLTAAKVILEVNNTVNSFDGAQVGTVGRINASPGAPNVIPGQVTFSLEIRDLSSEKIWTVFKVIENKAKQIAKKDGMSISFRHIEAASKPALADEFIKKDIANATKQLGYSYKSMPSGAGHDAQEIARFAPIGMIFIPSKDGISHSPKEFTSAEDMANGANVLLHTILTMDRRLK